MKKILMFVLMFLVIPLSAFAQTVTVTGMGGSEKTALKDAMRLAIESALGAYVDSQTISQNYTVIKDRINTHAEGFINKYEVLHSGNENGLYRVTIKADVRDDISNIILTDKEKRAKVRFGLNDPRIAVIAADNSGVHSAAVANAFIAGLKDIGFSRIVNDKRQADFLVTVIINENKTGSLGANFTLTAKVTNTKTGEVIFAGSESKRGVGATGKAKAVRRAADKLLSQIDLKTMELASTPTNHITLIINGNLPNIGSAQNYISNLPGVESVYLRRSNNNISEFDLDYTGDTEDFVALLESRGIKIKSVERDIIRI